MLTTTQAADALGISRAGVLKLLGRGLLKGIKEQRDWKITEAAVKKYQAIRRQPGWPKKA